MASAYYSGRIDIDATALEPIHHGAGVSGNTQRLRRQPMVLPDGTLVRAPFISGNSLKHLLRDAAVRYALDVMGVADGSLSKAVVDVLFSGGHLSKSSSSVSLDRARRLGQLFPALSLCGYSAGNEMTASKLRVANLHLLSVENAWRAPIELAGEPLAQLRASRYIADEFGTRHEAARIPYVSRLLLPGEDAARVAAKSKAQAKSELDGAPSDKAPATTQMIYEFESVIPGTRWFGRVDYTDITSGELAALKSALTYACQGVGPSGGYLYRVGAKSSIGCGLMEWRLTGAVRVVDVPRYEPSEDMLPAAQGHDGLDDYATHLRESRDEILAVLDEIGA